MIIDDTFGLSTSRGTGQRVGILSKILSQDNTGYKKKVKILVIITCKDNNGKIIDRIRCLPFSQNVEVDILDITENNILRCRACPICPAGDIKKKYTCIIPPMSKSQKKGDDMKMIHDRMIRADFIIIAHANGSNTGKDNFQVFLERTRFIRRNNFELANMGFSVYAESDQLTDIFILRGMTSFLRHNVFLLGPFYSSLRTKNSLAWENINLDTFASRIEEFAIKSKLTKFDGIDTFDSSYVPIGYMES